MEARIQKLTELTLNGEMYVRPVSLSFDRRDLFLSEEERDIKRLCAYIRSQEPCLTEYSRLTGKLTFDDSVVGDAFRREGHRNTQTALQWFYLKPIDNLSTMEWQHATADYKRVLAVGISGLIRDIDTSLKTHTEPKEISFLNGIKAVAQALIDWTDRCADKALALAQTISDRTHRQNLETLAATLRRVPKNAPKSFYEAVLCLYVCFSADPDSIVHRTAT